MWQAELIDSPYVSDGSAAQPALLVAWYNVSWASSRFHNAFTRHEETLTADLLTAFYVKDVDVVLLCECGTVGESLGQQWTKLVHRCCGTGFRVWHQSHYTGIVRDATVEVLQEPSLQGNLVAQPGQEFRMCQHLRVRKIGSAEKPIDLFNVQ